MCGQAGVAISEAYEWSPRQLHYYLNGSAYYPTEQIQLSWETARVISYYTAAPHFDKKKNGNMTMQKFLPLPWDKISKKEPITLERFNEINEAWQENRQLHS